MATLARTLALFFSVFTLISIIGNLRFTALQIHTWWVSVPGPIWFSNSLLACFAICFFFFAIRPRERLWRRLSLFSTFSLLVFACINTFEFYLLLARGTIGSNFPVPFSIVLVTILLFILWVMKSSEKIPRYRWLLGGFYFCFTMLLFPLLQMVCFGNTDYSRRADAAVTFGARVYASGRMSNALADRTRAAVSLYKKGLVKNLVFSGSKGDGTIDETEAMRRFAIAQGVAVEKIKLDKKGVNTYRSVLETSQIFHKEGYQRVLAVSHFYHLPRIKMTYQQQEIDVYTVPAIQRRTLRALPLYLLREVAAIWWYYLRLVLG